MAKCIFGGDGKRGIRMQIIVGCFPRKHRQNQIVNLWIFKIENTVGRGALIPTTTRIYQIFNTIKKIGIQNILKSRAFFYANLCRDEGNPTYRSQI